MLEGSPRAAWEQPEDVHAAPPGGESYWQLGRRVHAALADLHAEAVAGGELAVLLCTHSGALRVLHAITVEASDLGALLGPAPAHAAIVELDYTAVSLPPLFAISASGGRSSTGTSRTAPSDQG
jgi:broad specificity phosphatase PhoE